MAATPIPLVPPCTSSVSFSPPSPWPSRARSNTLLQTVKNVSGSDAASISVSPAGTGTIVMTGVDPVQVVEYAIVFSVVILPLSYYPILRTAANRELMGSHANGWLANTLGVFFLVLVTFAALAAIPLLIITHSGKG